MSETGIAEKGLEENEAAARRRTRDGVLGYLFGRNALIGVAALMLLALSGYATYAGMSDFILGVQNGAVPEDRQIGALSISTEGLIILLVVALTFLMWLALRETFGAKRSIRARLITLPLYLFLAIWSIGFGYGFWWSLIAGPEATKAGLSGQAEDVRDAAVDVKARLEAVRARLDSVGALSERQMALEASSGGSCGVRSGAGQGPLFRARERVRDSVSGLRTNIDSNWLASIDRDLVQLNAQLGGAVSGDTVADRQAAFERAAADIRGKARAIAARSDALGRSYAAEMRQLADEVSVAPGETGFSCYDPSLAGLLREAADEAEKPVNITLRDAAFSEGAAGVANAVLGLWTNIGDYVGALPGYLMGDKSESTTSSGQPITGRDLIALLAAVGVDLGLFALTVLNPPPPPRLSSDIETEMRRAIRVALGRTSDHGSGKNKSLEWLKKHIFHHKDRAYLVVPNFYSCLNKEIIQGADLEELVVWAEYTGETPKKDDKPSAAPPSGSRELATMADTPKTERDKLRDRLISDLLKEVEEDEAQNGQALNLLAGVLVDVKLIEFLSKRELETAQKEETRESLSTVGDKIGHHGILYKARHALKHAGWSRHARKDVEIYRLKDEEGLSPFLKAFNQADPKR